MVTETYVARWHNDEGHFTVLVRRDTKCLRILVQGHPCELKKVPLSEGRHIQQLDYPVKKAARAMRKFAKNNAGGRVRRFLDEVLQGART
jgi:hypothetical protein